MAAHEDEEISRKVELAWLAAFYGGMLTEKQRVCLDLRFNQDLSLGEIGQLLGVSRQAVCDNLARTEALLHKMEENIGCVQRSRKNRKAVQEILNAAAELESTSDPSVSALARRIFAAAQELEE